MSSKIANWLGICRPSYRWKDPLKKEHNRKSVSWHKRRILARLNPKVNKGQKIEILQLAGVANKKSMLQLMVVDRQGRGTTGHSMRRQLVQEHHRIVRALRYLVAEGKIESNMTTKEWDIQLALGTAELRTFTRKKER